MTRLLFVYGTLREDAPDSKFHLLGDRVSLVGSASVVGQLWHLCSYPGLVPVNDPDSLVVGDVYTLDEVDETLARLDDYEGCGPLDPTPHLFEREETRVRLASGEEILAWVYFYTGPSNVGRPIPSGDYLAAGELGPTRSQSIS